MDQNQSNLVPASAENGAVVTVQSNGYEHCLELSRIYSKSGLVPQSYQDKPQDCFVAISMAQRMDLDPLFVMQNLYVVKGKPSWAGQACIALINGCGRFKDVHHVYTGEKGTESRGCRVVATRVSNGEVVEGPDVTLAMAKAEGWTSNSKWRNMPELMLAYRSSAFFARVYCPEALMGIQMADEVEDVAKSDKASALTEALKGE
jgi:hypothetical protein